MSGGEASAGAGCSPFFERASALFFPFSANIVTIAPSRRILRIAFEPVFVPDLSARSFAAFATIQIARAERGRIPGEIDVGILLLWSAAATQYNRDQEERFLHCHVSPPARWGFLLGCCPGSRPPGHSEGDSTLLPIAQTVRIREAQAKKRPIREEIGRQARKSALRSYVIGRVLGLCLVILA